MKSLIKHLLLLAVFFTGISTGHAQDGPVYLTMTTAHWNWDNDGSNERWMELEKAWHDEVIEKNEHIIGSGVYYHKYSADNSEVIFVTVYPSWSAIEEAGKRNGELAKAAWPDDEERAAAGAERNAYYSSVHSDEIMISLPNAKFVTDDSGEPLTLLVVKRHLAFPDDAVDGELAELNKEFHENVTHKNPHLLGYYPHRHLWGSDGREVMNVFVVKSMDDLTKMQDATGDLIEAHWPDEEARKEFFKKRSKYYTPWHSDAIYESEPALIKRSGPPPADADAEATE